VKGGTMAWTDRLINVFRGRQVAREIDEELRFHIESRIRDNIAAGMTPEEAALNARARFGNRTATWERTRDADLATWLQSVSQDARFAGAMMRRHLTFTIMAIILLGLGIGTSTGMFSLLLATVFRSAPYERSGRLVYLARIESDRNFNGQVDLVQEYSHGVLVRELHDDDFDGKVETIKEFRNGKVVIVERDSQERGYIDIVEYYDDSGRLIRREAHRK